MECPLPCRGGPPVQPRARTGKIVVHDEEVTEGLRNVLVVDAPVVYLRYQISAHRLYIHTRLHHSTLLMTCRFSRATYLLAVRLHLPVMYLLYSLPTCVGRSFLEDGAFAVPRLCPISMHGRGVETFDASDRG